jgi:hypothetical protein
MKHTTNNSIRKALVMIAATMGLATAGALANPAPASAMECMVDCWDWNGGWQGGGGLSGGSAGTGGGAVGTGVGGGGASSSSSSDPGGTGWSCGGGTDAVYDDYTVITVNCSSPPGWYDGPDVPIPQEEETHETHEACLQRVQESVLYCQDRSDVVCAAAAVGGTVSFGPFGGFAAGAGCKVAYRHICASYADEAKNCR